MAKKSTTTRPRKGRPPSEDRKERVTFRARKSLLLVFARAAHALGITPSEFHELASREKAEQVLASRPSRGRPPRE